MVCVFGGVGYYFGCFFIKFIFENIVFIVDKSMFWESGLIYGKYQYYFGGDVSVVFKDVFSVVNVVVVFNVILFKVWIVMQYV